MNDALDVRTWCIDGSVQRESELIDTKADCTNTNIEHVTTHVDLHQTGCRNLVMQHAEWRYKEMLKVLANSALQTNQSHADFITAAINTFF